MRKSLFYEYYGGHLGFLQNITCYTCKKKMEPYFSDLILNQNQLLNPF